MRDASLSLCASGAVLLLLSCSNGQSNVDGDRPPGDAEIIPPAPGGGYAVVSAACAAEPLRSAEAGHIYYFCDCGEDTSADCVAGDDSRTPAEAQTASTPWRTFAKAATLFNGGGLVGGDTMAFCRGGSFDASSAAFNQNTNCSRDKTCDVRDYAPSWGRRGDNPLPLFLSAVNSHYPIQLYRQGHEEGFRFLNLDFRGKGNDSSAFWFSEDVSDVELCNVSVDGFGIAVIVNGSSSPEFVQTRIVAHGCKLTNNSQDGWFGGCIDCRVDDNYLLNNGIGNMMRHAIYVANQDGGGTPVLTSNMSVSRNEVYETTGTCVHSLLRVSHLDHLLIEDNIVSISSTVGIGCVGLGSGNGGYPFGVTDSYLTARRNRFYNVAGGMNIGSAPNATIEDNLITVDAPIYVGAAISIGESLRTDQTDGKNANNTVRNNTIYYGPNVTGVVAIQIADQGAGVTGDVVSENVVYYLGNGAGGDGFSCFRIDNTAQVAKMDYNACYYPNDETGRYGGGFWEGANGTIGRQLAEWQSATGFDLHSKYADPQFTSAGVSPSSNFMPLATSPLVNPWTTQLDPAMHASDDLTGKQRDDNPDIGAYER